MPHLVEILQAILVFYRLSLTEIGVPEEKAFKVLCSFTIAPNVLLIKADEALLSHRSYFSFAAQESKIQQDQQRVAYSIERHGSTP